MSPKIGLVHPVVNQLGLKIRLEQLLLSVLARMDKKGGSQFLDRFLRGQGVIDEQAATPGSAISSLRTMSSSPERMKRAST